MAQITLNSTGVASNGTLALQSNGTTTAFTIDTSQNVGIGTSSPATRLHVAGSTTATSQVTTQHTGSAVTTVFGCDGGIDAGAVYVTTNHPLAFRTNNAERMRIDSSGNVGVGTSSPNAPFEVSRTFASSAIEEVARFSRIGASPSSSNRAAAISFYDANNGTLTAAVAGVRQNSNNDFNGALAFYTNNTGVNVATAVSQLTERMRIDSSGNLLVGTATASLTSGEGFKFFYNAGTNPYVGSVMSSSSNSQTNYHLYSTGAAAYRFYVGMGGTVFATSTTISAISDIRYKENIRDLDVGLDKIMELKPRLYDWKEGKGVDIKNARGFIAQEFEEVFPDLIDEWQDPAPEGEEPYKSVRQDLIPVLVKAIQEQQAIITSLTDRLTALEAK